MKVLDATELLAFNGYLYVACTSPQLNRVTDEFSAVEQNEKPQIHELSAQWEKTKNTSPLDFWYS